MNTEQQNEFDLEISALLPIEIWEHILEQLDSSKDVKSWIRAWNYPDWDAILHYTKPAWLFDEVFPILFEHLTDKQQVLACRPVCKKWCSAVDNFLTSNAFRRPLPDPSASSNLRLGTLVKSLRDKGLLYTTPSPEKLAKILQSPSVRNPVIGRALHFDWAKDTQSILPFLTKFGQHIWDFRIEIHAANPVELFQRLQNHLSLLPNLKRLQLFTETELVVEQQVEQNLKSLQELDSPLAKLAHLESLDMTVFNQYRNVIMETILNAYASSLRRLTLYCYPIPVKFALQLQNLTELTLSIDSDNQLESMSAFNLPLKRLNIFLLRNSNRGSYPDFSNLFQTVNNCFSSTLRALSVDFPVTYSPIQWSRQGALPMLGLPFLKTLELKEATFHSFNFIAQLSALEYLHLYKYRWGHHFGMIHHYGGNPIVNEPPPEQELLDLKQLLDDPSTNAKSERFYQSNIWNILPRLKMFTLSKASNATTNITEQCYRRRI